MKRITINIGAWLRLKQRWADRKQYQSRVRDMMAFEAIMHPEKLKGCESLEDVNLDDWDLSNLTNLSGNHMPKMKIEINTVAININTIKAKINLLLR